MSTKQEIQISSVKLINGGNKGIKITYLKIMQDKNGRMSISKVTEDNNRPIVGTELLSKFDEFADYIIDINSIKEGKVTSTGITASASKFLLSGTIECFDGNKKSATNTPNVTEEDDYAKWDEVQLKVDELYKMVLSHMETEMYMATDRDIVAAANEGKEGFDVESLTKMTDEELTIISTKHLEKIGCVVMNPNEEDMPGGVIDTEEVELRDISAGDEKQEMFESLTTKEKTELAQHGVDMVFPTVDINKVSVDTEKLRAETERKEKAKEQLAKLKEAQTKIEQSIDEDDDFIPMRKVM